MAETMETVGKVADAVNKLGLPKIATAFAVVAGGLLWLPDRLLTKAKVLSFRNAQSDWIAIAFWVCLIFVLICFLPWLFHKLRGKGSTRKYYLERLNKLTDDEASCLHEFIDKQSRALELPSENPTVIALHAAGLIWRPSQGASPRIDYNKPTGLTWPMMYHINDTVWDILQLYWAHEKAL